MVRFSRTVGVFLATAMLYSPGADANSTETFVIVHGAWGGGWAFREVAERLEQEGHTVYRPTLTGLGERAHLLSDDTGLDTHTQDIVSVLEFESLEEVILVGHSYGGAVISSVASRVPERIKQLVFLEAFLLDDGESWASISSDAEREWQQSVKQGETLVPPWVEEGKQPPKDVPHPYKTVTDPLQIEPSTVSAIPFVFVLTTENTDQPELDDWWYFAEKAREKGAPVLLLEADHNPQWSNADGLARLLMTLPGPGE